MKKLTTLLLLLVACSANAVMIDATDVAYVEDFASFAGLGFSPTPTAGQLNSNDWIVQGFSDGSLNFGETGTSGDFARGSATGSQVTGGVYAFITGGNTILGIQPSGADFTPGNIQLRLTNNTGQAIDSVAIAYDVFALNDEPRANSFNFAYATDPSNFITVSAADFTSQAAADNLGWSFTSRSLTISTSLAAGSSLILQWYGDDVSGIGARDQFGLDNVSVTFSSSGPPVTPVPEPGALGLLALGLAVTGLTGRRKRL
jgi:hypothetical protein